ncbi:MAG TPA: UvrD-helicase domain-containing protein, partial [Terriglobales bacterium]|nr:UvrD-helicase domain-containing protein [Terriglobales bacterium]
VELDAPAPGDPELARARETAEQLWTDVAPMRGGSPGTRNLRRIAYSLRRLAHAHDPADAVRILNEALRGGAVWAFDGDVQARAVFKSIYPEEPDPYRLEEMKGPHRWLAARLVRLAPVACAMYERVKSEHEVVDYLDLLIKLRDLLRDRPEARRFYQSLLDHIFVDEFQDTDPLQCEIVFYLCEQPRQPPSTDASGSAAPASWKSLDIAPGKLTIVGDPQQSIYRFRRADIDMYRTAVDRLRVTGALECRLETNFRSRVGLIDFYNRQLAKMLGSAERGGFESSCGRAAYEPLHSPGADAAAISARGPAVHVLPYGASDDTGLLARDGRAVEAAVVARYIHQLLASGEPVRDPVSNELRPVRPGDIAVLACVTTNLPLLLRELDGFDIEYAARGGTLFFGHPVVRQYLLALRALADRDDGIAVAALMRPPFFALDLGDVVASRAIKDAAADERRARVEEAKEIITRLRRRRFERSPGATARDLIELTGLGRSVASGRNGAQSLSVLYEVAAELDRRAALSRLDYDAASELARSWAERPVYLDPAEPIGSNAVRVMTVHGAKGLEFPVTVLWDGFQRFGDSHQSMWSIERDGRAWALALGRIAVEHPAGNRLLGRERLFNEEESKRKYYVAATRARDLLVVPLPATRGTAVYAHSAILDDAAPGSVRYFDIYRSGRPPAWAQASRSAPEPGLQVDACFDEEIAVSRQRLTAALTDVARPLAQPAGVAAQASVAAVEIDAELTSLEQLHKARGGRFGPTYGTAVHLALQIALTRLDIDPADAVSLAAASAGLQDNLEEAQADVNRALASLLELGVARGAATIAVEYPVVALWPDGKLVTGLLDLLVLEAERATVIDFKTDPPPPGKIEWSYRAYAEQLRLYGELLRAAGLLQGRELRQGLLFTADGVVRWLEEGA